VSPGPAGFGQVLFTASAYGTYVCDPVGDSRINAIVTAHRPGNMAGTFAVPAAVSTDQTFTVSLTVSDNGRGGVNGVTPALSVSRVAGGAAGVTRVTGPVPATGSVPNGGALTFTWTYSI